MGDALTARPPDIMLYIYNDCACQSEMEDMECSILKRLLYRLNSKQVQRKLDVNLVTTIGS